MIHFNVVCLNLLSVYVYDLFTVFFFGMVWAFHCCWFGHKIYSVILKNFYYYVSLTINEICDTFFLCANGSCCSYHSFVSIRRFSVLIVYHCIIADKGNSAVFMDQKQTTLAKTKQEARMHQERHWKETSIKEIYSYKQKGKPRVAQQKPIHVKGPKYMMPLNSLVHYQIPNFWSSTGFSIKI